MDLSHFDFQSFVIVMAVLVVAITIHEFSHAITADRLGDPTPRSQGRISLFPTDHLDPIGTIMMVVTAIVGRGIGWGKPVMTRPGNFRNPRRDSAIVALAGPVSNILQALFFALIIRAIGRPQSEADISPIYMLLMQGVHVNLALAFFNMLPIAPLDGHWVVAALLPFEASERFMGWTRMYGPMILMVCVFMIPGLLYSIYGPAVQYCEDMLFAGM